mgnify:CR=1 FL=1
MNSLRHCVEYTESSRELVRLSSTEGLQATAGIGTWGVVEEPCPVNLNWLILEMLWVGWLAMAILSWLVGTGLGHILFY